MPVIPGSCSDCGSGALATFASSLINRMSKASFVIPAAASLPAADVPVLTTNTAAYTITGGEYVTIASVGRVTAVGDHTVYDNTNFRNTTPGGSIPGWSFYHYGDAFEIPIFPPTTETIPYYMTVNGIPTADLATPHTISLIVNNLNYAKFTFPSVALRRIEFFLSNNGGWYPMAIKNGQQVVATPRLPVFGWIGDSYAGGNPASAAIQCYPFVASQYMGVETILSGLSGTGYVNPGIFSVYGDPSRVAFMASQNPEVIIFDGSVNDVGFTKAQVQAAATACYNAYAAALPNARFIVFGPQPYEADITAGPGLQVINAGVQAAATAHPSVLAFYDQVGNALLPSVPVYSGATTYHAGDIVSYNGAFYQSVGTLQGFAPETGGVLSQWILLTYGLTGTGNTGAPAGDGTRDTQLFSDQTHPTVQGSLSFALYIQDGIRKILTTLAQG